MFITTDVTTTAANDTGRAGSAADGTYLRARVLVSKRTQLARPACWLWISSCSRLRCGRNSGGAALYLLLHLLLQLLLLLLLL